MSSRQILFREYELQQNRVLTNSTYPIRFKESVADLFNNYIKVHNLILDKPECLVKPELETTLQQGVVFERRLFHGLFGTEDQKEGMAAFVEKRPGNWTGK